LADGVPDGLDVHDRESQSARHPLSAADGPNARKSSGKETFNETNLCLWAEFGAGEGAATAGFPQSRWRRPCDTDVVTPTRDAVEPRARRARLQPTAAQVGFNRLFKQLLSLQAAVVLVMLVSLRPLGLTIDWASAVPALGLDVLLIGVWMHLWRTPGRPGEWFVAEIVAAFLLMLMASHILAPAQYAAVALKRPLIDPALAQADASLGIDVAALAAWTRVHPVFNTVMRAAYFSFLPQLALLVPLTGFVARDREAMWEAVFHFEICAVITVLALALFPVAHAFQYLQFQPTLNESRLIQQFNDIRSGAFKTIQFDNLEGLVSMPSFHFAGALIVLRAVRRRPLLFWPALVLNVLLTASTVFTGAHYAVDLLGTIVMFGISVWCWNGYAHALLEEPRQVVPRPETALAASSEALPG